MNLDKLGKMSSNPAQLISINAAARILGVSTKTLRLWEKAGRITPLRTEGGHRRYAIEQVKNFHYQKEIQKSLQKVKSEVQAFPIPIQDTPAHLYTPLAREQKFALRNSILGGFIVLILFGLFTLETQSKTGGILQRVTKVVKKEQKTPAVLQAATSLASPTFAVNVPAIFRDSVTFDTGITSDDLTASSLTIDESFTLTAGVIATPVDLTLDPDGGDTTFNSNVILADTFTLQVGGLTGITYNAFASTGELPENSTIASDNDLYIGGDLEVDGIIYGNGSGLTNLPVGDATTVDGIDSSSFLRSDTSDSYTSGTLSFSDGTFLDLSAILHDDTALQGLRLPQAATLTSPTSGEGFLAWDSDDNALQIYNGSSWSSAGISGSGSANRMAFWSGTSALSSDSDLTYDSTTNLLNIGSGGVIGPTTDLGADLGTSSIRWNNVYAANIDIETGFTSSGQLLTTYNPADTTFAESSIRVNVTTPSANEQMLGIGQAGEERAAIDAEGDLSVGFDGAAGSSVTASADPFNVYGHGTTRVFGIATTGNFDSSSQTIDWSLNAAVDALNFDSNTLSIDASSNRVGIGNAAPTTTLDVTGTVTATDFECTTCIDTGDLNTTTGVQTAALTAGSNAVITMNDYSFSPGIGWNLSGSRADVFGSIAVADTVGRFSLTNNSTDGTYTVRWRYVTSSRDQEIFAWFDTETQTLQSVWVSEIEKPDILPVEPDRPPTWIPVQATIYDDGLTTLGRLPDIDNILKNHTFTLLAKASEIDDTHPLKAQKITERDECLLKNNNNKSKCFQFITHSDIYYGKLEPSSEASQKWAALESQMRAKAENNKEIIGSDIAEYYDGQEGIEPGEIVSIDTNSGNFLARSSKPYDSALVGIVSTAPGQVLGNESVGEIKLSLTGRVPVKIASTSVAIKPGDFITSSNELGKGIKATKTGYTVGKALESWDPDHPKEKILVFVNLGYYIGDFSMETSTASPTNTLSEFVLKEENKITTESATTIIENTNLQEEVDNLTQRVNMLETISQIATPSATTYSDPGNGNFTNLNVLGESVFGNTVINGVLNIGTIQIDNLQNSIDAIGTLKIQPLSLGEIEFMNGSIKIDKKGNLEIKEGLIRANSNIRDTEVLEAEAVEIVVEKTWEEKPKSINANASYDTYLWIEDLSENGFTIKVKNPPEKEENIYWSALW